MYVSLCVSPYPDEQLGEDHVGHGAGEVQRRPAVPVAVGLVHLLLGAVGQQQHHRPQVVLHHRPQQLLAEGHVRVGQGGQEELLLVLGPDPALLLLPAQRKRGREGRRRAVRGGPWGGALPQRHPAIWTPQLERPGWRRRAARRYRRCHLPHTHKKGERAMEAASTPLSSRLFYPSASRLSMLSSLTPRPSLISPTERGSCLGVRMSE